MAEPLRDLGGRALPAEWFAANDYAAYFGQVFRRFGWRALDKQFRKTIRRPFSRALIERYAPTGWGLEIGVGSTTIAPMSRTVLSDAFEEHASHGTLAKMFFTADAIPFADATFSFLLTEHTLEHIANPLKALAEWKRVLRPGAPLILVLPHKERTFDRHRARTKLAHIIEDFERGIGPNDDTHLEDFLDNVIRKGLAPHYARYTPVQLVNNGLIHHHVWVTEDVAEMLAHAGFEVVFCSDLVEDRNDSMVVVARRPG